MPKTLTNQTTSDDYTPANTVQNVYKSRGGWIVNGAPVLCQQQISPDGSEQGSETFGDEFILPSGAHYLEAGTIGIRFRSATPGVPVLFSTALFFPYEPAMVLGGSGIATPSTSVASLNFQKNDIAVATEPTADFIDAAGGNNLIWTVVDDAVNTRVKITPTWASPTVFPNITGTGSASLSIGAAIGTALGTTGTHASSVSSTAGAMFTGTIPGDTIGFRFRIVGDGKHQWGPGNAAVDSNFGRLAVGVVGSTTTSISTGPVSNSLTGAQTVGVFVNASSGNVGAFNTAATTVAFLTSAVADTVGYRWQVTSAGLMSWGPGNAAVDTTLQRVTQANLGNPSGTATGLFTSATNGGFILAAGGIVSGSSADVTIGNAGTWTPDLSLGNFASATMATAGATTMTIAAPINRPPAQSTMFLVLRIHNTGGSGGVTITWNAAFDSATSPAMPTSVLFGKFAWVHFVWDSTSGVWVTLSVTTQ